MFASKTLVFRLVAVGEHCMLGAVVGKCGSECGSECGSKTLAISLVKASVCCTLQPLVLAIEKLS